MLVLGTRWTAVVSRDQPDRLDSHGRPSISRVLARRTSRPTETHIAEAVPYRRHRSLPDLFGEKQPSHRRNLRGYVSHIFPILHRARFQDLAAGIPARRHRIPGPFE